MPEANNKGMWHSKNYVTELFYFWLEGMNKLKDIEEYYEIKFDLKHVSDEEELNQLYKAIDAVHDGIKQKRNCSVTLPADAINEDLKIKEPVIFEEHKPIPLKSQIIQGVVFKPYCSYLLPCKIKKKKQGEYILPACCEYTVEK